RGTMVFATDSIALAEQDAKLAHGRLFGPGDLARGAQVVVISDRLAGALAGDGERAKLVGDTLRLQDAAFQIVGILAPLDMPEPFNVAAVPFTTAAAAFAPSAGTPPPASISAHLHRIEDADSV